ncbi:TPA: RHS repeat-associated core domain-containing protein [Kluyvera intermedia]|nr:RHS repeat-associated core domain-containing protein [Kluyvera intermedia]
MALINAEWSAEYDAWGNVLSEHNPHRLQQLIRLPGQQYDGETGLYYNRYRYYDPLLGRYITQDPIGLECGWNPYMYPLNPVTEVDPRGCGLSLFRPYWKVLTGYFGEVQPQVELF